MYWHNSHNANSVEEHNKTTNITKETLMIVIVTIIRRVFVEESAVRNSTIHTNS
jgi:hypothetical protein